MNLQEIVALIATIAQLVEQYGIPLVEAAIAEFKNDQTLPAAQLLNQIATRLAAAQAADKQVEG